MYIHKVHVKLQSWDIDKKNSLVHQHLPYAHKDSFITLAGCHPAQSRGLKTRASAEGRDFRPSLSRSPDGQGPVPLKSAKSTDNPPASFYQVFFQQDLPLEQCCPMGIWCKSQMQTSYVINNVLPSTLKRKRKKKWVKLILNLFSLTQYFQYIILTCVQYKHHYGIFYILFFY